MRLRPVHTFLAVAFQIEHCFRDGEIAVALHFIQQLANDRAFELDDATTHTARYVTMMARSLDLIPTPRAFEALAIHKPQLLEKLEVPVYCGETDSGVLVRSPAEDLFRIEVAIGFTQDAKKKLPVFCGESFFHGLPRE